MKKDHYSVLGVTPASEDVVIRAAYRALMRRYHPDADASPEAAERAREINEAYRVLSEPESRARYDDGLKQQSPLRFDPESRPGPPERKRSRIAPMAAIGFATVAPGWLPSPCRQAFANSASFLLSMSRRKGRRRPRRPFFLRRAPPRPQPTIVLTHPPLTWSRPSFSVVPRICGRRSASGWNAPQSTLI